MKKIMLFYAVLLLFFDCSNQITMDFPDLTSDQARQSVTVKGDIRLYPNVVFIPRDSVIKYFIYYSYPGIFYFKPDIIKSFPLQEGNIILSSFNYLKFEYILNVDIQSNKVVITTTHESLLNTVEYLDIEYSIPFQVFRDSLSTIGNTDSIHFTTNKGPAQFTYQVKNENYVMRFRSNMDLRFSGHIHIENHEIQVLESKLEGSEKIEIDFSNQSKNNPVQLIFNILKYPLQLTLEYDSIQIPVELTIWNKIVAWGMRTGIYKIKSNLASEQKSLFQWISPDAQDINFDGRVDFSSNFEKNDDAVSASLEYSAGVTIQFNNLYLLTHYNLWSTKSFDKDKFEQDVILYSTNLLNKEDDDKYQLFLLEK